MMRLRLLTPVICISILILTSCSQDESVSLMPVTTDSELALEFYETGLLAFDQIKFELAYHNLELAVKEDPNFFMAHFWLYFMAVKSHKEIGEEALQTESDLNEGEKQIRTAFKYLRDGQDEKVVNHLKMAVDLYPSDPHVHKILYILQFHYLKDPEGALESINRAIESQPEYASAYNQLGYVLMELDEFDRAERAFDTYIKLAPSLANPYDSKGDYYMHTEQYQKAYESYTMAFEIDCDCIFSEKKAQKAKYLLEKTSGE
ncbi:MAG: tetratricopeptide repeat protein [Bacteroidales bacterium]|nr:tetratricopeptide repeat protein [Bacteroidales bacterium]